MERKPISDEEFYKKYEAFEKQQEDIFWKLKDSEEELKASLEYLIERRQKLMASELELLESKAQELLQKLRKLQMEKILEEIACFKDIIAMQRQMLEDDGNREC